MQLLHIVIAAWLVWVGWLLLQRQPYAAVGGLYGGAIGLLLAAGGLVGLFIGILLFGWAGPTSRESRSALVSNTWGSSGMAGSVIQGGLLFGLLIGATLGRKMGLRTDWDIEDHADGTLSASQRIQLILLSVGGMLLTGVAIVTLLRLGWLSPGETT